MTDNDYVSREEHETFKQNVIDFLGILVQAFDKNVRTSRATQASIDNLTQTIEDLAELQNMDSQVNIDNNRMLNELYGRLIGPGQSKE